MDIIINNKSGLLFFLMLGVSVNAQAFSNVDKTAGISVNTYYTDNVRLADTNEESDLVIRVAPRVGVTTEGSRLKTQLNYTVSGLAYNQTSKNDDIYHNLSSSANAEIIKNTIFLDGFANTRQVLLNQNKNASSDLVSGSQNTTTTYTYGLTPSWKKKWGNYATSDLSYGYNRVTFGGNSRSSDSTGEHINFTLVSGTKFDQYFWDLNYDNNETRYDDTGNSINNRLARDTKTKTSYLTLGYHYSRRLDLRVRLGYEDYDYTVDDGFGWTIGGNWHPSARTSLDASWGRRAFGRTAFLDFSHRTKRITWQINYSDDVTNSRGQIINDSQTINDGNINPDDTINIDVPLASYNPNLRLTRRLTGSASYQRSKSTFTLNLYAERIYYEDADNKDTENRGTSLDWGLTLGGRTTLNSRVSWSRLDDLRISNTQDRKELSVYLNRNLTPDVTASIGYTYKKNTADLSISEYTENRISANLSKNF